MKTGDLKQQRSERFYLLKREEKGYMGTWELVVLWVRLEIGFL
jgi:hypothetical protein